MLALVTGGGGFLGRYIVEQLLARGDSVRIIARGDYSELHQLGVTTYRGDIQHLDVLIEACKGVDLVFHTAAYAGYWGAWQDFYRANVTGTQNVIAACHTQNVPKLIYTSSPSVIFNNQAHEGVNESIPYPVHYENYYSHTKAIGEQLVLQANQSALLTVSLRPHLIIGKRDVHILPRLIAQARKGALLQVGEGHNLVDLTYVEDAARAHLLAADALTPTSPTAGAVYFISQDEPVNLWGFIRELLFHLNLPPVKRKIPLSLARFIGATYEGLYHLFPISGEPRLTRFLASELALSHYYNISRAKKEIGYTPQFCMTDVMRITLQWLIDTQPPI